LTKKIKQNYFSSLKLSKSLFGNGFHTNAVRNVLNNVIEESVYDNDETLFLMMCKRLFLYFIANDKKIEKWLTLSTHMKTRYWKSMQLNYFQEDESKDENESRLCYSGIYLFLIYRID
jgi:hypothetical protein